MAKNDCAVNALDLSSNAIEWAKERASEDRVNIDFHCISLFDFKFKPHYYNFIYDCGLFHYLAPHRRLSYIELLKKALKANGHFDIVCFNTDGGFNTSDREVYKEGSLKGG